MAFTATTEWEVRTTGADTNGGGFDAASTGTDYSQRDTPFITYTDLKIDGTTATKCTSTLNPFTAAHVGNIINITAGTGFTVQRVQVLSVASGVATCDKSLGTLSSTGGQGKLGGGFVTLGAATALFVTGNICHIKSGTYTVSSTININPATGNLTLMGYNAAHRDNGTAPLITTATNSVSLVTYAAGAGAMTRWNVNFSHTAATRGYGMIVSAAGSYPFLTMLDCVMDGFITSICGDGTTGRYLFNETVLIGCEIKNCTGVGLAIYQNGTLVDCWIHNNTLDGVKAYNVTPVIVLERSIFSNNGGMGFNLNVNSTRLRAVSCVFAANTGDGLGIGGGITAGTPNSIQILNSVFYGSTGGWGINVGTAVPQAFSFSNAFGANSLGAKKNFSSVALGEITLTGNPFNGASDFSLNSTTGAGALLKRTAFPATVLGSSIAQALDVGAVQTSGSTGAGSDYPAASNVRSGTVYGSGVYTGTMTEPAVTNVRSGTGYGAGGTEFTGSMTEPAAADVRSGVSYGAGGTEFTGSYAPTYPAVGDVRSGVVFGGGTGNMTEPAAADVKSGVQYGTLGTQYTGSYAPTYPAATDVRSGVVFGGGTGNMTEPAAADVRSGVTFGANGTQYTGSLATGGYPAATDVRSGVHYDPAGATVGNMTEPAAADVRSGVTFGASGTQYTGSYAPAYPAVGDVRSGVVFGGGTGNMTEPAAADVKSGVQYGTLGTQYTGSYAPTYPAATDVRSGVVFGGGTGNMTEPAAADVRSGVSYGANGTQYTGSLVSSGGGATAHSFSF